MRIGILTFHKPVNYGAFLQAFSLSERLKKEYQDADVEIIDYIAPKEAWKKYTNILRDTKRVGLANGIKSYKKKRVFQKSLVHLSLSKRSFCTNRLEKLYHYISKRYDCLVIGSDAVFNWNQNGFPSAFVPNYDFGIPVFTYAASVHGLKYYDIDENKKAECRFAFEKMSFIGVRDACTEKFVKYCCPEAQPKFCCDPTLFIDCDRIKECAGNYQERIQRKYGLSLDERYIVLMAPDSELTRRVAEKYRNEYRIIALFKDSKYADAFLYDLDPFEWAMVLRSASITITSYFHGTLLSLVQGTPAIVLDYSGYDGKYQGKLYDLMMTRFELPNFYFDKQYAINFAGDDTFFTLFENMMSGAYMEEINRAVRQTALSFRAFYEKMCEVNREVR